MSWPISRLGEVISFIRGVTFTPEDQVEPFSEGSTVVMRTKNVQVAGLDQSDLIAVPSGFVRRKEQALREGDILVSSANSWELVGKASYVPKLAYEATAGGFISIVRAKESRVDSRYLYHWVACPATQHKIRHCGRQTTNISNLDVGRFQDLEILLPPLPEQKRIAAILDKADAIRRKRQQAIQLADDFLRAVFLDMFGEPVTNPKGWSVREVGDLCDVQGGLQVSKKRAGLPVTAPYLRVANVLRNRLDLTEIKEIELLESEYRRVKLIPDDILIVEGHGNANEIGRCAIWKGEIDEVVHQNHLIRVRVKSKDVNPRFLSDYINSSGGRAQMMRASNSTSGLNTISTGVVRSTGVIVPPKDLQDKYALIVEKTNSNLLRQNFAQVLIGESVFSLSQKAFSGQL
ncbi:TPA: restriction endonuclease subunit S [Pseudomonas aeruginosa]